jgi:hypothetical protein
MAKERSPQQTTMHGAFQDAEWEHRAQVNELFWAADTLGYSGPIKDSLKVFLRLVYDQTREGHGPAWQPERGDKTILSAAGGPSCGRSKLRSIIADARDAGILLVEAKQAGSNAYRIGWEAVYVIRGRNCPQAIGVGAAIIKARAEGATSEPPIQAVHAVDSTVHGVDTSVHGVDTQASECTTISAHAGVDLIDLVIDDEEERNSIIIKLKASDPIWRELPEAADRLVVAIYAHRGSCPSLSTRTRVFLLSAALLGKKLDPDWFSDAVETTAEKKATTPPAFLRTCLATGLAANHACDPGRFEQIVGRLRGVVGRFLAASPWDPAGAFRRLGKDRDSRIAAERAEHERQRREAKEYPWIPINAGKAGAEP